MSKNLAPSGPNNDDQAKTQKPLPGAVPVMKKPLDFPNGNTDDIPQVGVFDRPKTKTDWYA